MIIAIMRDFQARRKARKAAETRYFVTRRKFCDIFALGC